MMDEEYQALIESGFPSTNDSAPDLVDESSAQALREEIFGRNAQQEAAIDPSLEVGDGGEGDAGDSGELGDESERKGKRRKNASGHMTDEEKKSKQRDQNRRAAEKSRSKKRNEFNALETEVNNLQDENTRLRARLSALHSSRNTNGDPSPPLATPSSSKLAAPQDGTNIDYAYLDKIQSELRSVRQQLIDKEHQLAQLRGEETPDEVAVLHQVLLDQYTSLKTLQAESSSLESLVSLLDKEKEEIVKQTEAISMALQARGIGAPSTSGDGAAKAPGVQVEDVDEDTEPAEEQGQGVQKALAEIRGWVDAAVRDYQTSAETAST